MIKQALDQISYSFFAETALVMFAIIFVVVVARTLMTRSEITERQARIVLGDKSEKNHER